MLVSSIIANPAISTIGLEGGELTTLCFAQIPVIGTPLLIFGILTFAYSTILGWSYYGERCMEYLFGKRILKPYRVLWIVVLYLGCTMKLDLVWTIADTLNGLMALPNLIALALLSGVVVKCTKEYFAKGKSLEEPKEIGNKNPMEQEGVPWDSLILGEERLYRGERGKCANLYNLSLAKPAWL